jgi:hypothetical protein
MSHRTRRVLIAVAIGTAAIAVAAPALAAAPQGTPPDTSHSHLTIPITGECAGQSVTVVAGDSDHAAAQIISGGTGHLIPVSFTFVYADGTQSTTVVHPHLDRPTVTCDFGGVGPAGSPVEVEVTAVWQ